MEQSFPKNRQPHGLRSTLFGMYVPVAGLGRTSSDATFNRYRWFYLWDQFNGRWIGPQQMNDWEAREKIDYWRLTHPNYYAVGTPHLLEDPYMVYWTGKRYQRYCQFINVDRTPGCVSDIV